jgi:HAD superfamily hydrolase (TIGR01662 family)
VLLDFDGPVCSVFAGWPAPDVAEHVRSRLLAEGMPLSEAGRTATDPLEVLRDAGAQSARGGHLAEGMLAAAELICVESATPTKGVEDFLRGCQARGISVAIVSNNSEAAVRKYLDAHGLTETIAYFATRDPSDAALMKPNPHLLRLALAELECNTSDAVMIGDSRSDMQAAVAAGVRAIGYVNKPIKAQHLSEAGADFLSSTPLAL